MHVVRLLALGVALVCLVGACATTPAARALRNLQLAPAPGTVATAQVRQDDVGAGDADPARRDALAGAGAVTSDRGAVE